MSHWSGPRQGAGERYDHRTIAAHWAVAGLVVAQWIGGQTIDWFAKGGPKIDARSLHLVLGTSLPGAAAVLPDVFDHVTIKVGDLAASRLFYEPVLQTLGLSVVFEVADQVVGFGRTTRLMFEIAQAGAMGRVSQAVHLAFAAADEVAVMAFHAKSLELGAADNGPPGLRPEYEAGYFAAYVIDPNGHNLEAVAHVG